MIVASTARLRDSGLGRDVVVGANGLLVMNTGDPDLPYQWGAEPV